MFKLPHNCTHLTRSDGKASACNVGDLGSIPGLGRSLGEGNGNPLQYSCLENPTDGGAWQATVHGVTKSQTRLSNFTHFTCQKSNAQKSPSYSSAVHELRTSRYLGWIQERERNQRSNCQHPLDHRKSKRIPEKTSASLTKLKPLIVWITTNCGKF